MWQSGYLYIFTCVALRPAGPVNSWSSCLAELRHTVSKAASHDQWRQKSWFHWSKGDSFAHGLQSSCSLALWTYMYLLFNHLNHMSQILLPTNIKHIFCAGSGSSPTGLRHDLCRHGTVSNRLLVTTSLQTSKTTARLNNSRVKPSYHKLGCCFLGGHGEHQQVFETDRKKLP